MSYIEFVYILFGMAKVSLKNKTWILIVACTCINFRKCIAAVVSNARRVPFTASRVCNEICRREKIRNRVYLAKDDIK